MGPTSHEKSAVSSSSSAVQSQLLDIGLSNCSSSRSIFGYTHPAPPSIQVLSVSSSIHHQSAHHSPLLDIGLSNRSPFHSAFGYSHPTPASRPAQIIPPPGLSASCTDAVFTPELVYPIICRFYG
jgi:hypothetical protein